MCAFFGFRQTKCEVSQLQRHVTELQKANDILRHRIEELDFRLSNESSSPKSPFNPVFTQSPSSAKPQNARGRFSLTIPEEKITEKGRINNAALTS